MGIAFGFSETKEILSGRDQTKELRPRALKSQGSRPEVYFFAKVKPSPVVRTMSLSLVPEGGLETYTSLNTVCQLRKLLILVLNPELKVNRNWLVS